MKNPKITTIIPTFRRPEMLERAIKSVMEQDYSNIKICVYDNNSQDKTKEVVENLAKIDSRIHYFCHDTNIGGLNNFLFAMKQVQTEYFSFLSDDDYLLPQFYNKAINDLENCKDAMFWAGMSLHVDEHNTIWYARLAQWEREGIFTPPEGVLSLTGGMAPAWTSMLFRKNAIDQLGLLDISLLGPCDLEYCLRLAAHYPYIVKKHPSAVFVLNSQSYSTTQPLSSFWPGWKKMINLCEKNTALEVDVQKKLTFQLRKDAEKMLFRRGANAIAARRLEFAKAAADVLVLEFKQSSKAYFLYIIIYLCSKFNILQSFYTYFYKLLENRMIKANQELHYKYKHLLR